MMSFVKPARRACRHGPHVGGVTTGHTPEFFRRNAVACANQSVETIAAFGRVDVSICENRYRLRRVVTRRIEVSEIVGLRVDRLTELVTHAEFETQLTINFPTI